MHFLFQQATINRKTATVPESTREREDLSTELECVVTEMFIMFDSSNEVFNRMWNRSLSVSNVEGAGVQQDRYPTYGVDIPNSCMPNNFHHVIFGESLPFLNGQKYAGQHVYFIWIKRDRCSIS